MKSNLEIKTSFVSPVTMKIFVENEYLPIFILRSIVNSGVIGKFSNTAIHFRELSPSSELFHQKRDHIIDFSEFKRKYILEVSSVNLENIITRLENLVELSGAKGVVLLGYGSDYKNCHRTILSELLNKSNLLSKEVSEFNYNDYI